MIFADEVGNGLHGKITGRKLISTAFQFFDDKGRIFNILFVFHFMFQTCPGIHGNGPQLQLRKKTAWILSIDVFKRGRHFNNDVVTAVSIRFYVTDIVFLLDDPAERKAADGLKVGIDIIDKTTDNPNTNGII